MNSNKQIKLGAVASYIGIFINIIAGFIYTPWMVRQIGQSDYGLYSLALSVVNFFLLNFGISGIIVRYISLYKKNSEEHKIPQLLGVVFKMYIVIDIIICAILIVIFCNINNIFVELTPEEIRKFKLVFLMIGGFTLFSFPMTPVMGIYSAYERFAALKLFNVAAKITTIIAVVVALILGYGLYALVIANTFFNFAIKVMEFVYIKRKEKIRVDLKFRDSKLMREILVFSFWMVLISFAQRFVININPTIIGALSGTAQVAVFSVGSSIEGYTWTFANALNGLFLPKVTRLSLEKNYVENITNLMIKVGRIQLFLVGMLICAFASMGREFVMHWMGADFINSYYVALCLILPGIVTLTQEIAINYLVAINEVKWRVIDFVTTAIISVCFAIYFIPKYGAIGAAFSAFIGLTLGHVIIMNMIFQMKFKLNILRFFKECHLKLLPWLFAMFLVGRISTKFIVTTNLVQFFIKCGLWCVIYMFVMWIFVLNSYEKGIIVQFISKIKAKIFKKIK